MVAQPEAVGLDTARAAGAQPALGSKFYERDMFMLLFTIDTAKAAGAQKAVGCKCYGRGMFMLFFTKCGK